MPHPDRSAPKIAEIHRRGRNQAHLAENAAQSPEILVLQVRSVRPAVDLDRQRILARLHILGNVEFGSRAAILAEAHFPTVHPDVERRRHSVETQQRLPRLPALWKRKPRAIRADRVVVGGDERRFRLAPRIGNVHVNRNSVSLDLHVRRHPDRLPTRVVEVGAVEILRPICRPGHPMKLPVARQRAVVGRVRLVPRQRRSSVGIEKSHRTRRLLVDPNQFWVFPVVSCLLPRGGTSSAPLGSAGKGRHRDEFSKQGGQRQYGFHGTFPGKSLKFAWHNRRTGFRSRIRTTPTGRKLNHRVEICYLDTRNLGPPDKKVTVHRPPGTGSFSAHFVLSRQVRERPKNVPVPGRPVHQEEVVV